MRLSCEENPSIDIDDTTMIVYKHKAKRKDKIMIITADQTKREKDILVSIQKNLPHSLESLYGTRYQGKGLFIFTALPYSYKNVDFEVVLKFYVKKDGRYEEVSDFFVYTIGLEHGKKPWIRSFYLYAGDCTPGHDLYADVCEKVKEWRAYCLQHYIDMSD